MSKKHRKKAEQIIEDSIKRIYNIKIYANTGNYILNQLLKAGYTSDKIIVHLDEIKDELDRSVFKCKTNEEPFTEDLEKEEE